MTTQAASGQPLAALKISPELIHFRNAVAIANGEFFFFLNVSQQ
jgi:hypothetical protein